MTETQYADYEKAVQHFHDANKLRGGLNGPVQDQADPFFSWRPCECCNSPLGGNREKYSFVTESGDTIQAVICSDCVYYLAYGQLDDLTMMEIEAEKGVQS